MKIITNVLVMIMYCYLFAGTFEAELNCNKACDLRAYGKQPHAGWNRTTCVTKDYCWDESRGCELSCYIGISVHTAQILYNPSIKKRTEPEKIFKAGPSLNFGYNLETNPPIAASAVVTNPRDGCHPLINTEEVQGKIALINRGSCTFRMKIHNADVAGAVGVVVIDNIGGSSYESSGLYSLSGSGLVTSIPALFIYNDEGNEMLLTLSSNPDIYLYLGLRKVAEGTPCGSAKNTTVKNASTQYTVTDNGITAAYVCNDGFLWRDGAAMIQDSCRDGQWRPLDYDSETWDIGCTKEAATNSPCSKNTCPQATVCEVFENSTRCLCPHDLTKNYFKNIISEELPFMTDGNLNSCEIVNNSEPLRRKFIDVVLEKNCPSQDPINLTIKFGNVQNLSLIKEEQVLYSKTVGHCHNCSSCNAILTRCIAAPEELSVDSYSFSCGCTGSHCQFMLAVKPLTHVEVCEISIKG